jgi:hypothetical protein
MGVEAASPRALRLAEEQDKIICYNLFIDPPANADPHGYIHTPWLTVTLHTPIILLPCVGCYTTTLTDPR